MELVKIIEITVYCICVLLAKKNIFNNFLNKFQIFFYKKVMKEIKERIFRIT